MIAARSDVVGSLLRPQGLMRARLAHKAGLISAAAFKAAEDRAVDEAVRLQEDAGLEVVTDGEMRRLSFQSQMTEAVDGFGEWDLDAFLWGDWRGQEGAADWRRERPESLGVTDKLVRKRALSAEEFVYLRARASRVPKVTLPSPGLFVNFWSPEVSAAAYPTLDAFLADVVAILRLEVEELAALGAAYVQIDAPHYLLLLDPATRDFYESRGWTMAQWLDLGISLDNALMEGMDDVTFGFHLCRGNQNSRWLVEGGYDAIAEPIFRRVGAERLLLEYDDARSGSFAPLAQVPDDRMVVLGLVSTKGGALEDPEALVRRIDEAARYVGKDRLALSPQCGFATSIVGNELTLEDEKAKLALVAETARRVWG